MIDIHCHILPGIDDGARDLEEALAMASFAQEEGITGIIATPHYIEGTLQKNADKALIDNEVDKLNNALQREGICLQIYTGSEAFISPKIPELVKRGVVPTLNGSRYILVELPVGTIPIYTENFFYELQLMGLVPVIVHPERKKEVIRTPEVLTPFLEKGVLLQVNSSSLMGFYGDVVAKTAWNLLERRMIHFIATDAHNARSRAPAVSKAYEMVGKRLGPEAAQVLFEINPSLALMDGEVIEVKKKQKKTWTVLNKFIVNNKRNSK